VRAYHIGQALTLLLVTSAETGCLGLGLALALALGLVRGGHTRTCWPRLVALCGT
jgi:hypothetical protein